MHENTKTLTLVGVAAVAMLLVWVTRPTTFTKEAGDPRGELLVADFEPQAAASLDIVEFDEDTATVRPFKVAKAVVKGKTLWSIPSHENYPTDAKDQLGDAAAGLMGLKILQVVSDSPGDHALYGVRDPDPKTLKVGDTGVGTRVTMKDQNDKDLLALIVGKAVPDKPELRYFRRVGDDRVYVVQAKTDKISTKFENWIEKDLLKLSTWDIKQLWIRDYSVDQLKNALIQRGEMTLDYNDTGDPKWKMLKDEKFRRDGWAPVKMADDEELNTTKLDELKTALGDLKIVDVTRKPEGLSADLKAAADFAKNRDAALSLADRGFFFARVGDKVELYSNEGEVRSLMKDGVQYVLRFGEIAPDTSGGSKEDQQKDKGTEQEKKPKSTGLNRYLFVTAEFDADIIPKPQLESLPEEQKEAAGADDQKTGEKQGQPKKSKGKKAKKAQQDPPKEKKAEDKPAADKPAAEKEPGNGGAAEKEPGNGGAASEEKKPEEPAKDDKKDDKKAAADAERERIEKENKRKQEEYDEKVKKGKEHVTELNARFADWYYVISDEVYRKIHLTRADIIKKKEKPKEEEKPASEAEKPAVETDKPVVEKADKPAVEEKPAAEPEQTKKDEPPAKE